MLIRVLYGVSLSWVVKQVPLALESFQMLMFLEGHPLKGFLRVTGIELGSESWPHHFSGSSSLGGPFKVSKNLSFLLWNKSEGWYHQFVITRCDHVCKGSWLQVKYCTNVKNYYCALISLKVFTCKRLLYTHLTCVCMCVESFHQHNVRGLDYFIILLMQWVLLFIQWSSAYHVPHIFLGAEDKRINTIDNIFALTRCLHSCEGVGLGEETQ